MTGQGDDDQRQDIPDTVAEMLGQMAGLGLDLEACVDLGKGLGAVYKGALEETNDPEAAAALTGFWITALVQNPNADDD
jgi:hypothetical protein